MITVGEKRLVPGARDKGSERANDPAGSRAAAVKTGIAGPFIYTRFSRPRANGKINAPRKMTRIGELKFRRIKPRDARPMERLVRRLNFRPGMHTADKISSSPPAFCSLFHLSFIFVRAFCSLRQRSFFFFRFPNRRYSKQIDRRSVYPIESDSRPCNQNGGRRTRDREPESAGECGSLSATSGVLSSLATGAIISSLAGELIGNSGNYGSL